MDFSEAVAWWEEWQLRVLVLTSLFLQFFLLITAALRKHRIPAWFRFLIWIAYLGSDAVAIYALAALFNSHQKKQEQTTTGSTILQVLWAPILLLHLGGQNAITAYNIEDNELWRRHILTAVSQVTVAMYVFYKSWSNDNLSSGTEEFNPKTILKQAINLFIPGAIKCLLKPWDLKRISINRLIDFDDSEETSEINSLHEYIRAATQYIQVSHEGHLSDSNECSKVETEKIFGLFVDLAPPYSDRLACLEHLLQNPDKAHHLVQSGLSETFNRLYTKESLSQSLLQCKQNYSYYLRPLAAGYLIGVSAAILNTIVKFDSYYNHTDVKITYALIFLTLILEIVLPFVMNFNAIYRKCSRSKVGDLAVKGLWSDQVSQYNLLWYLARDKRHRKLVKLATLLVCKDYLDQLWCMESSNLSRDITQLIHDYVRAGWLQINDIITYRKFNDNRGKQTLDREGLLNSLGWSLKRPFDESVLLWHLATDFTFYLMDTPPAHESARQSKEMSNYMVYLLFINPEMLMPGARRSLFRTVYNELKDMIPDVKPPLSENEITQNIIQRVIETTEGRSMVLDALKIAQELIAASSNWEDDKKMWRMIQGVWVEMLCFSAGRCRGYLHAKSLGKGGEYLSYVWLLLSYMGMETLAEKMQRTGPYEEGEDGGINIGPRVASLATVTSDNIV